MPSDMDSWAGLIRSRDEMPALFGDVLQNLPTASTNFPYMIYAPEDRWGWRETNPKLLCLQDKKIFYAEKSRNKTIMHEFGIEDICYLQHAKFLLYSWIKLFYRKNGQSLSVSIEFNSVVEKIFSNFVISIRNFQLQVLDI